MTYCSVALRGLARPVTIVSAALYYNLRRERSQ